MLPRRVPLAFAAVSVRRPVSSLYAASFSSSFLCSPLFLRHQCRCGSSTVGGTPFSSRVDDNHSSAAEEEQDRTLEEEEFAALSERDEREYLPLIHRLAEKADAMDQELARLRWVLFDRRQLLMDTKAATLSGRPTRADKACAQVRAWQTVRKTAKDEAVSSPSPAEETLADSRNGAGGAASHGIWGRRGPSITAADFASFLRWRGVPSVLFQLLSRVFASPSAARDDGTAAHEKALATLTDDLDYLRRGRALHALNYYSRMTLTPKRHLGHSLYQVVWNAWLGLQNGCGALVFGVLRGVTREGLVKGSLVGAAGGVRQAGLFLLYGWVISPCIHLPRGLCNSLYGPLNAFSGAYFFDAMSGRWTRCTVLDAQLLRHRLQREKRLLRAIGRAEFRRKRMAAEGKWSQLLSSVGFSLEGLQRKMGSAASPGNHGRGAKAARSNAADEDAVPDPYQTLGVRRSATQQQIKQQYKKLAMVFHPDVVDGQSGRTQTDEERVKAHETFGRISSAYQTLSNPEKRKAYDLGGAKALSMHEGKFGRFMSRTQEQMVQSIFGGEGFRRVLLGELLRSHWSLRFEAQVSVSLHEFEELQCIRVRQVAMELAAIADVHAKRPSPAGAIYYKSAAARGVGAGRTRMVQSSSLPDPFGGHNAASVGLAARHPRSTSAGTPPAVDSDLKESILTELGGTTAAAAAAAQRQGQSRKGGDTGAATPPQATASSGSPYVLVPGSNEYNCFSRDFEERCDRFVSRMSEACFGPELLREVGEAYTVSAQRFLHIKPFYAPKLLMSRKIASGIDRVWHAFLEKTKKMEKEEMAKRVVSEYFNMEYDNVVADVHVVLRFSLQLVLQDCTESEEVRRKRCYAVWYLGERMLAKGTPWDHRKRDDADTIAYVQQAATSSSSTAKPPAF